MSHTHLAFSDDSGSERYQSLSLFSVEVSKAEALSFELQTLMQESNVDEFKWEKLRSAKYRFAAQKIIRFVFSHLDQIRVDTLIWDKRDARHSVTGRDDKENRVRMYYHLVSNTCGKRWPVQGSKWHWRPDKQSSVDWQTLWDCISSKKHPCTADLFAESPDFERVSMDRPVPSESHEHPFIQVADLFAGAGSYSWEISEKYKTWKAFRHVDVQPGLFGSNAIPKIILTNAERERFEILELIRDLSTEKALQISYESTGGLQSHKPSTAINFWPYRSKRVGDVAPVKKS